MGQSISPRVCSGCNAEPCLDTLTGCDASIFGHDELRVCVCVLLHLIYLSMYTTDKVPSAI